MAAPSTPQFYARGVGNGLPYCPEKIDLTQQRDINGTLGECDYWITLGGTQKGNAPTAGEIALSLENAMKLLWTAYSVTGSAKGDETGTGGSELVDETVRLGLEEGVERRSGEPDEIVDNSEDTVEPFDRTCHYAQTGVKYETTFQSESVFAADDARVTISIPEIVAMYNGDTDDPANFVGYGVRSVFSGSIGQGSVEGEDPGGNSENGPFEASGRLVYGSGYYVAKHTFVSYLPDEDYYFFDSRETRDITYSSIGGVPMIEIEYNSNVSMTTSGLLATASLTALEFYDTFT